MADLPDWYTQVQSATLEATSFRGGLDADKPASPAAGDIYLARDTFKLYVAMASGVWTGFDASILVQGLLTLFANLAGGGYRITNIGDPTAAQDAATRAYVLAQLASYLLLAGGTLTGNLVISKADPVVQLINAASRTMRLLVSTEPYLYLQVDNGSGSWVTVFYCETGVAAPVWYLYRAALAGTLNANSQLISNLATPVSANDAARKAELDDISVAAPSRAIGTIYQNTSGKIRVVCLTGYVSAGENLYAEIGAASPPTSVVGQLFLSGGTSLYAPFSFPVPPSYYYRMRAVAGAPAVYNWYEFDLL